VARFFRITKAVPTPSGMNRNALGETEFEMQQIVGYGLVEPDGSIRAHVPADTAINITVLDGNGRSSSSTLTGFRHAKGSGAFARLSLLRLTTTIRFQGAAASMPKRGPRAMRATRPWRAARPTRLLDAGLQQPERHELPSQAPISITYSGLNASPVKGPASCATTWSAKDCAIVINFPDHIQPILAAKCSSCHSGINAAAGLDLSAAMSESLRVRSATRA